MSKSLLKIGIAALLTAAVAAMPLQLSAQTNQSSHAKKESRTPSVTPFRGKLTSVDQTAKTITIGKRTIQITSETKIMKGDKPGTLEDAVVGENATGGYRMKDGKMVATKVNFGAKPASAAKKSAKEKKQM